KGISLQSDGKILQVGYHSTTEDVYLFRYNSDGSLDTSFDSDGKVASDIGGGGRAFGAPVVQVDGKILVAAYSGAGGDNDVIVLRYNTNGSLDTTFGINGKVTTDLGNGDDIALELKLQSDGKILVVGTSFNSNNDDIVLLRYNTNGSLDTSFDSNTTLDNTPSFTEGGAAVVLDSTVDVRDTELDALNGGLGNYDGASVTLSRNGGVSTDDVFSFSDGNGITLEDSSSLNKTVLQKGGVTIATFDTTTIPGVLRITFTNANGQTPTSADVDSILRQITYANSSDAPPASAQIDWAFSDGNTGSQGTGGALQATGSTTVTITAVNDASDFNTVDFTTHIITTGADGASSTFAADLDGDGDMDVLSADQVTGQVTWYENDGSGTFTNTDIVGTNGGSVVSVTAADVDGDGDLDVLSASYGNNEIAWYENDGSQGFTKRTISTGADGAISVTTADVDGDGDLDVLSASQNDDKIAWYENDGSQDFTEHTISIGADKVKAVITADVDGDGDLDVLSASYNDDKIAWYENDGSQGFTERVVNIGADKAYSVAAADIDGDGDLDVLSADSGADRISWYENDGSQGFTQHDVVAGSTYSSEPRWVTTADMDDDGDLDVLVATENDRIIWYENDGNETFTEHAFYTDAHKAREVTTADFDGDGDLDVLSASFDDDKIAWYENTAVTTLDGAPTFIEGGTAVVLDADVDISDVELDALNSGNGDYHGASVTLVRNGGVSTEDVFSFSDGNGITLVTGTVLQKAGATIASFNITTTPGQLVITFTNANGQTPTSTDADNILQQITYANSSDDPPASAQIDWSFDD
ncbi:MAG: hypothetical protein GY794_10575, partial [bacterium]|nr:hypothetical protein [bacterium]